MMEPTMFITDADTANNMNNLLSMKHLSHLLIATLICALTLLTGACSSSASTDIDQTLNTAETAIMQGDIATAASAAAHLGSSNYAGMSARQLARLSIIFMQIADSVDNEANVQAATELFRLAIEQNEDSANAYFRMLPSEKTQYHMMLSSIVANQDHPYDLEADTTAHIHIGSDNISTVE